MSEVAGQWSSLWPALAFLLLGVPLAALLDQLGFFDAAATAMAGRGRDRSVLGLWVLAATTTIVLNLDTTVVLLTPLYLRLARRSGTDPLPLVAIPLFLASFASSVLPVSNLTNLIVTDQLDVSTVAFLGHLALPSVAASAVGWLAYRRRYPRRVASPPDVPLDLHALRVGGAVVGALLVGFVVGPSVGIAPWMCAAVADVVLVGLTRVVPWRQVPVATALGVAAIAAVVAVIVPADAFTGLLGDDRPLVLVGISGVAAIVANVINNLPALLVALDGTHRASWGIWAWLLGINQGRCCCRWAPLPICSGCESSEPTVSASTCAATPPSRFRSRSRPSSLPLPPSHWNDSSRSETRVGAGVSRELLLPDRVNDVADRGQRSRHGSPRRTALTASSE